MRPFFDSLHSRFVKVMLRMLPKWSRGRRISHRSVRCLCSDLFLGSIRNMHADAPALSTKQRVLFTHAQASSTGLSRTAIS